PDPNKTAATASVPNMAIIIVGRPSSKPNAFRSKRSQAKKVTTRKAAIPVKASA
ncbi:unnamed protein product, partial [marine sediment metagenome]